MRSIYKISTLAENKEETTTVILSASWVLVLHLVRYGFVIVVIISSITVEN